MLSSPADTPVGLALKPDYPKFWQSISSSPKLSPSTNFSNIKLDIIEVLKLPDSYELWSQKMLVIIELKDLSESVLMGIDLRPLASVEESITFQISLGPGLLEII
jgi:hypothetical protein